MLGRTQGRGSFSFSGPSPIASPQLDSPTANPLSSAPLDPIGIQASPTEASLFYAPRDTPARLASLPAQSSDGRPCEDLQDLNDASNAFFLAPGQPTTRTSTRIRTIPAKFREDDCNMVWFSLKK